MKENEPLVHRNILGPPSATDKAPIIITAVLGSPFVTKQVEAPAIEIVSGSPDVDPTRLPGIATARPSTTEATPANASNRAHRIGSWLLHPASNLAVTLANRGQAQGERVGALLGDRIGEKLGEEWAAMPSPERANALATTWRAMTPQVRRALKQEARQQLWETLTPGQRALRRAGDVAAWGVTVAVAGALVLRSMPGLTGRIADGFSSMFGDPNALPDVQPSSGNVTSIPSPTPVPTEIPAPEVGTSEPGWDDRQPVRELFSEQQLGISYNMGLYELFNKLGLTDPVTQAKLLESAGPSLVKDGLAYVDPNIGGYGLMEFNSATGGSAVLTQAQAGQLVDQYNALLTSVR